MDVQQATMTQAGNPIKQTEMATAIESLTAETQRLQETVSVLSARLGPMLSAGSPTVSEVAPDIAKMEAEYPDKVNTLAYAIADQHRALSALINRLEV